MITQLQTKNSRRMTMWPTLCQTCDGVPSAFPDCTLPGNLLVRPHTALFDAFQLLHVPHAAPATPVTHTHTETTLHHSQRTRRARQHAH